MPRNKAWCVVSPPVVWARLGKAIFTYWLSLASRMQTHDGGQSEFHVAAAGTPFAHTCLSVRHRFVAFINMRAVSVYPSRCIWYHFPPTPSNTPRLPSTLLPPSPPRCSHPLRGDESWEPHKISLKTTRSAEANLWAPFILITTLWERFRDAICVTVSWSDCKVPGSLVILWWEKQPVFFFIF